MAGFQHPRIQTWERSEFPFYPTPTAGDGQNQRGPREREGGKELETPSVDQGR